MDKIRKFKHFQLVDNFRGALAAGVRDVFLSHKKGCSKKII